MATTTLTNPPAPATSTAVITPTPAINDFNKKVDAAAQIDAGIQTQLAKKPGSDMSQAVLANTFNSLTPEQQASFGGLNQFSSAVAQEQMKGINQDVAIGNLLMQANKAPQTSQTTQTQQSEPNQNELVDGLLSSRYGISTPDSQLNQTTQTTDPYQGELDKLNTETVSAYDKYKQDIASLQNGTFPYTPTEQAQIQSLMDQFEQLKQQQLLANKNFEGGTAVNLARGGTAEYANQIASGQMKQAIDDGIAKIAKIEQMAMVAVNDLKSGIEQKNYKMINDAYDRYSQFTKQRADTLQAMQKATADHAKEARDFNYKVQQDSFNNTIKLAEFNYKQSQDAFNNALASSKFDYEQAQDLFKNTIDSDKFTWQQTQDNIQNALAKGKFTEEQRHNLVQETNAAMEAKIKQQAADPFGTDALPSVQINTATGKPNKAQQQDFLSHFPPDVQQEIKDLASYQKVPGNIATRNNRREEMTNLAHQYDPNYNEMEAPARQQFLKNWTSGELQRTRLAINTGINHLGELKTAADALQNKKFQGKLGIGTKQYNTIQQLIADNSGDPSVKAYDAAANKVAAELAKIYKGNASPTQEEIQDERSIMERGLSPQQMGAVLETSVNLIAGKLQAMREQYTDTLGQPPSTQVITDSARKTIDALNKAGIKVDINALDPRTTWANPLEYGQDHPEARNQIKQLKDSGLADDEIMQVLGEGPDFSQPLSMGEKGSAKEIAKAIKQVESGGNYNARGESTEGGAYQFMPASWKEWAGKFLGNPNAPQTPKNQDAVAEARIGELLAKGHSPKEIALIWNGGQPVAKKGTNKFGVKYDSGAYANKVLKALG